jgi:mannose-6-phosphate isomerase class I
VARYGADPALLVKILDTGERLVVHFHPDRDFAARHLGSRYGKTEAWIILDALHAPRPDAAARPFVTRLLPARADAFFRASLVDVAGPVVFEPGYAILVVVLGEGRLAYPAGTLPVRRGSAVLVPYGAGPTTFDGHFQALRCRPPVSLLLSPLPGVLRALWGKRTKQCGRRYSHDRRADLEQRPQPVRQPLLGAAARVAL